MNYSIMIHVLSSVLAFEGLFLLLPCIVALIYGEAEGLCFLAVALGSIIIGGLGRARKVKSKAFYSKEGLVTVSLSWIIMSLVGALPYFLTGEIPNYVDAVFETVSGFTTTGASIMPDVEILSKCSAFWRCFTNWIGGMGVLVLVLAILPLSGSYNMHIMRAESPGPSVGKLVPKVKTTAMILYGIYAFITALEVVLLMIAGMSFYEAITISMATAGTGGFALLNSSIGSYTVVMQVIITIFMLLCAINFNVYYLVYARKPKEALACEEMRVFLLIVLISTVVITFNIAGTFDNVLIAFQTAAFQVASVITTTGFSTADFDKWPELSRIILLSIMFIGGCAGSTGGGLKVSRFIILLKSLKNEIISISHPRSVKRVHMEGKVVSDSIIKTAHCYLFAYVIIVIVSTIVISVDGFDITTNLSAVMATFNNIGPGLGMVGPTGNFSQYSIFSKIILTLDMLIGRLEIFPMFILFSPKMLRR